MTAFIWAGPSPWRNISYPLENRKRFLKAQTVVWLNQVVIEDAKMYRMPCGKIREVHPETQDKIDAIKQFVRNEQRMMETQK